MSKCKKLISQKFVSTTSSSIKDVAAHNWTELLKFVAVGNHISEKIVSEIVSGTREAAGHNCNETLMNIAVDNPFSQKCISLMTGGCAALTQHNAPESSNKIAVPISNAKQLELWEMAGEHYEFIRLAALFAASAIFFTTCGEYILIKITKTEDLEEAKNAFKTANIFHNFNSLVILVMPLVHRPKLTGSLMAAGTILFSGPMYYRAFTGDKTFNLLSTLGSFCLVTAWLTLLF